MLESLLREHKSNFEEYAKRNLYITTKETTTERFALNKAQQYIHARLEKQREETGRVRALILKGRQQGCSTYVSGRYYWKATHSSNTQVFILAHEGTASDNLFKMANRYHDLISPAIKVSTGKSNAKELVFDKLGSGYKVGTAGNKQTGRSSTIHLLHGSEVAFWDNAQDIAGGALQAVPDLDGTEVILESTANGIGNFYYDMCMDALRGEGDYQLVFVPWFWQDDYRKETPNDLILSREEQEYKRANELDDRQIFWRRNKIKELGSDWLFKQEYPANVMEAFQTSGEDSYISPETVQAARNGQPPVDDNAPLIIGVDPARFGDDRIGIAFRQGRASEKAYFLPKMDTMQLVSHVVQMITRYKPLMVNIDVGGLGAGVYDRLKELAYEDIVREVNFGGSPLDDLRFKNKRAEMWGLMRDWLEDVPCKIVNDDALQADICCPSYKFDSNQRLQLESKEDIKKRGMKSPDLGDALALTFAFPVRERRSTLTRQVQMPVQFESIFY